MSMLYPGGALPRDQPSGWSVAVPPWDGWWWWGRGSEPAGHAAVAALLATPEGVVAEERDAREVDVDVDRALAGGGPDDVDQPGVERLAGLGRHLLGLALDRLGDAEGDPGQPALLVVLAQHRGGRRC